MPSKTWFIGLVCAIAHTDGGRTDSGQYTDDTGIAIHGMLHARTCQRPPKRTIIARASRPRMYPKSTRFAAKGRSQKPIVKTLNA
jgi:hypothetical protein